MAAAPTTQPGTLAHASVSVGNTATSIAAADLNRLSLSIFNNGAQTVYIGDAAVVVAAGAHAGMPIPAGAEREVRVTAAVYGIVASGTAEVRTWAEAA